MIVPGGTSRGLGRRLARLEAQAAQQEQQQRERDERLCHLLENATGEEAKRLWVLIVAVMAANAGEANTLRDLQLHGGMDEEGARALLAAAQEWRRQNPDRTLARLPHARFDSEGKPYATAAP